MQVIINVKKLSVNNAFSVLFIPWTFLTYKTHCKKSFTDAGLPPTAYKIHLVSIESLRPDPQRQHNRI